MYLIWLKSIHARKLTTLIQRVQSLFDEIANIFSEIVSFRLCWRENFHVTYKKKGEHCLQCENQTLGLISPSICTSYKDDLICIWLTRTCQNYLSYIKITHRQSSFTKKWFDETEKKHDPFNSTITYVHLRISDVCLFLLWFWLKYSSIVIILCSFNRI